MFLVKPFPEAASFSSTLHTYNIGLDVNKLKLLYFLTFSSVKLPKRIGLPSDKRAYNSFIKSKSLLASWSFVLAFLVKFCI